jgi:beta-lactamase regulating signal transducer with metallopeptidase domain
MESLFEFLIRSSAGIALLYIVYWMFLRNETFYRANRWFLLFALVSAVLLPLFPLHYSVMVEPEKNTTIFQALSDTFKNIQPIQSEVSDTTGNFGWKNIILTIYITGTAIFLFRLISQTLILIHLMIKYQIKSSDGIRIVENEKYGLPFSFFNVVFINPKFHTQASLPEILAHEKVHIREFHWFDLLFIELLTVIFWFNPFIWFFEHAIKQNHEYLADKGVLANGYGLGRYQALLINQLMGMQIIGITNNLNFALNTNRFKMMTKKETSRVLGIKFVWALPAIALLLFAFAEPAYKVKETKTENSISAVQKGEKEFVIKGTVVREDNGKPLSGASVIIKGTSIGTVTDAEGKFTLIDPNPKVDEKTGGLGSELVVSYVGFESSVCGVMASGSVLENGRYTFKLKEGVIQLDLMELLKELPPPPPPPKPLKNEKTSSSSSSMPSVKKEIAPSPPPPPPVNSKIEKEVFIVVEELPEYPRGMGFLANDVMQMEKKMAKDKNVKGKATVGFTIDETGKPVNVKIIEADNELAGKSAASIIMNMKNWKPGSQRGKPVPVNYILPVEF